jgi:hypothetical protein
MSSNPPLPSLLQGVVIPSNASNIHTRSMSAAAQSRSVPSSSSESTLPPSSSSVFGDGRDESDRIFVDLDSTESQLDISDVYSDPLTQPLSLSSSSTLAPTVSQLRLADQAQEERNAKELAELAELVAGRVRLKEQNAAIATARAEAAKSYIPPVAPAILSTPLRPSRPPLTHESTRHRQSIAAQDQQASIDQLPSSSAPPPVSAPLPAPVSAVITTHRPHIRLAVPKKFSSIDPEQNNGIENWCEEINRYIRSDKSIAEEEYLDLVLNFFTGPALTWHREKEQEVQRKGKIMTWPWVQSQLIKDFGRANGALALRSQWKHLRMGRADGDKPTLTVTAYNTEFARLMYILSQQTWDCSDTLYLDRYLDGIEKGWPALYTTMLGVEKLPSFVTLREAKDCALISESALNISRSLRSSSSSSSSSHRYNNNNQRRGVEVSNMFSNMENDDTDMVTSTSTEGPPQSFLNAFTSSTGQRKDGGHSLTAVEKSMLWQAHRCWRCYGDRREGHKDGKCTKAIQKAAPPQFKALRPLKEDARC